jgi:glycosyltransferase involved in cell wall biosynthesis
MLIRVAMVADYPASADRIDGGLQAVTFCLVEQLRKMKEVDLHVINFRQSVAGPIAERRHGFSLHTLPLARLGTLTGFHSDQKTLNSCLARIGPDVVHSQGGGHHGILAMRSGLPAVVTIHGILAREAAYHSGIYRQLRSRLEGWFGEQIYIKRGSDTILISPYVAEYYESDLEGRKHLIPNPVDDRFFEVERGDLSNTILFAGRLYALKGVKDLVRAVSRIEDRNEIRLVLAGAPKDHAYLDELRIEIGNLGLNGIVEMPGILDTKDLLRQLAHCLCLVLPSYQETAPMVIQEAMAAGVPVIASNICGIPYQVADKETGFLIAPGDIDELARKIQVLLSNPELCERFGTLGRQFASRHFRASVIARRTFEVYLQVIGKSWPKESHRHT